MIIFYIFNCGYLDVVFPWTRCQEKHFRVWRLQRSQRKASYLRINWELKELILGTVGAGVLTDCVYMMKESIKGTVSRNVVLPSYSCLYGISENSK